MFKAGFYTAVYLVLDLKLIFNVVLICYSNQLYVLKNKNAS